MNKYREYNIKIFKKKKKAMKNYLNKAITYFTLAVYLKIFRNFWL